MNKIGKIISFIITTISIIILLWFAISWVEIIIKNVEPNPQYWEYNFFDMWFGQK